MARTSRGLGVRHVLAGLTLVLSSCICAVPNGEFLTALLGIGGIVLAVLGLKRRLPWTGPKLEWFALLAISVLVTLTSFGVAGVKRSAPTTPGAAPPSNTEATIVRGDDHVDEAPADSDEAALAQPDEDPPPPTAHLASELPELEAKLTADRRFQSLTPEADSEATRIYLTVVSKLVAEGRAPIAFTQKARRLHLMDVAITTYLFVVRSGRLPDATAKLASEFLEKAASAPHLGTWSGDQFDVTALAAWLRRDDVRYLRELISARQQHGWTNYAANREFEPPWIPWLALPGAAYERLSRMTDVSDAEWASWCDALDLTPRQHVDPQTGRASRGCGCGGDGQPVTWEEMRERWPLSIPGGCLVCVDPFAVVFKHKSGRYAINGTAGNSPSNKPIDPIWADDPRYEQFGFKISIEPLISLGLRLCGS